MKTVFVADLGGTKVAAAILDATGKILARKTEPVDTSSKLAPAEQVARLASELGTYVGKANAYISAAVAIPGLVRRNGTVWAPNLPGWDKVPLARLLQTKLKVPVVVESDRNAAVLGETFAQKGAARGKTDVVVMIVGTGIGVGILSEGRLVRGAHELSGCAGWMVVTEQESAERKQCGTLEAFTAGPGIARSGREVFPKLTDARELADKARNGNRKAKQVYQRAGTLLGYGVANLVSLFDPQVVVFAGGMSGAADLFWDDLLSAALDRAQPLAAKQVRIKLSRLGGDANLYGCAKLAWEAAPKARAATAGT